MDAPAPTTIETVFGPGGLEARLSFKFAMVQRLLDRQMQRILSDEGLSLTAYRALALIEAFGETTAATLVRLIGVDKGLISRLCADMVAQGLLTVMPDPENGRQKLLGITAAGRAMLATYEPQITARNAALDSLYSEAELQTLHGLLNRIIDEENPAARRASETAA